MIVDLSTVAGACAGTFAGVTVVGWRVLAWLKREARGIVADALAGEVDERIARHEQACRSFERRA
jgi:hypothetical protein